MSNQTTGAVRLDGRIAIVTGGTQGLGEAIATDLIERGAKGLVICGRSADKGRAVAERLTKRGCKTEFVRADLGVVEDCRKVVAAADRAFGRVDVLVNAAAITDRGTIFDTSPELFDTMFAVNVRAGTPPAWLVDEITSSLSDLASYPRQDAAVAAVAARHAVAPDRVLLTAGAAEAFVLIARAFRFNGELDWPGPYRAVWTMEIVCPRSCLRKARRWPDPPRSALRDTAGGWGRPSLRVGSVKSSRF
jgi:NAD(P)-dependent dehydrogenase (short-subunit alcohol dehydrogenase family)